MGMFDWVNYKMECPTCKKEVDGFQTKDTACDLETVEYWECDNFYTTCCYCHTWISFFRQEKRPFVPIEHFTMRHDPSTIEEERFTRDKDGKIIAISGKG